MFKWEKKGLIFSPTNSLHEWMSEYAQCPFTLTLQDRVRVYTSTRSLIDENGNYTARSGYVDLNKQNISEVIDISDSPIVGLGGSGEFDQFGSMAGSVVYFNNKYYLYYCGWQRLVSVPYNWAIGLAVSDDGKNFQRYGNGPIVGATSEEPYLQACPIVKIVNGVWHMWYLSGLKWLESNSKKESMYQLMHATSTDGINWNRNGQPILPEAVEYECQTSCSIIEIDDKYHMWFSYRHGLDFRNKDRGYKIGYAWSDDLETWHRNDSMAGISLSESGWDSEMVCYPHVAEVEGKIYMFYCGNDFGKGGFGYAELVQE